MRFIATVLALGIAAQTSPDNPRNQHHVGPEHFTMRVVANELDNPWDITWGPDGYLWVTERSAFRVTRINPADGSKHSALTLDDAYSSVDQDGRLGLALHPDLLTGRGRDYVDVAYTHDIDAGPGVTRHLRVRRYTYERTTQTLTTPTEVIDGLPAWDDHGGGRLRVGPDGKLYLTRGDHGSNWLANACNVIRSQELPAVAAVRARDWSRYQGKILRLNLDGSIPDDNPILNGVRSHIYTYGHRNPQGLVFASNGLLYSAEHGPSTDDELNLITAGGNYGWPLVAGFKDDRSYVRELVRVVSKTMQDAEVQQPEHSSFSVPQATESSFTGAFVLPLVTFFTVPAGYELAESGTATIAPSGLDLYTSTAIPGWAQSLIVAGMRTGAIYRAKLSPDGRHVEGEPLEYFKAATRYRDLAISPDGLRIYASTDDHGPTMSDRGQTAGVLANPGAILEFTYRAK